MPLKNRNIKKIINIDTSNKSLITNLKNIIIPISLWNPYVAGILKVLVNTYDYIKNEESKNKLDERISLIIVTIKNIFKKIEQGISNYESNLICPELFRQALLTEDIERAKEHLAIAEQLYSSGRINFDPIQEALRIMFSLSDIEYKVLKYLPTTYTTWKTIFKSAVLSELQKSDYDNITNVFISLHNKNLIDVKTPSLGPALETNPINIHSLKERIKISQHGKIFLDTIKAAGTL